MARNFASTGGFVLPLLLSGLLGLTATVAWLAGALPLVCLLGLMGLTLDLWGLRRLRGIAAFGLWIFCVFAGFAIALYRPPGFDYPQVQHFTELGFTLYLNIGKALAGLLVIIWLWRAPYDQRKLLPCVFIAAGATVSVLAVAHLGFDLDWHFKWPEGIIWFLAVNLGATVLAEEAFFRLLLQDRVASALPRWCAPRCCSVILVSVIFALAHAPLAHPSFLLFLWAGGVYAAVYTLTRRFSMAVLTHFGVNFVHFVTLTYPL